MGDDALILQNVQFSWPGRSFISLTVHDFRLRTGESVLLLGESGSGKSTLLSIVCGILKDVSGRVVVCGTEMEGLGAGARDRFRADNIGVIFQQFNLLPYARVRDNILLPLSFAPERRRRVRSAAEEALELCVKLGLPQDILDRTSSHLSVGQQQRVAAARALIGNPPLIVADEPTSSLDEGSQDSFLRLLFGQLKDAGTSLLMVSHDHRLSEHFDRTLKIEQVATLEAEGR